MNEQGLTVKETSLLMNVFQAVLVILVAIGLYVAVANPISLADSSVEITPANATHY